MNDDEDLVLCDTIITRVAGYGYHATAAPLPGEPVRFIREPQNPWDRNAVAILDAAGRRLGYLFKEIAGEYAALMDCGCVRHYGRMAAPDEAGYDPARVQRNPGLYVWVYADDARLTQILAAADVGSPSRGAPSRSTASAGA